jgi:hypothetical protein
MKKVDKSEINWRQGEKPMYKAALVHGYQRRGKNIGTMTHGTFDLNFCPVCGTKLEEEQMEHSEENCSTCAWHDSFSWVCFNGLSEHRADFTDPENTCPEWKERKDEND